MVHSGEDVNSSSVSSTAEADKKSFSKQPLSHTHQKTQINNSTLAAINEVVMHTFRFLPTFSVLL